MKKMLDGRWLQSFKKVRKRLSQGPGRLWCQHTKPFFLQRKNVPEKETPECQGHAPVSRHVGGLYTFNHGSQQARTKKQEITVVGRDPVTQTSPTQVRPAEWPPPKGPSSQTGLTGGLSGLWAAPAHQRPTKPRQRQGLHSFKFPPTQIHLDL